MKTNAPKVLSEVLFKPMLKWVLEAASAAGVQKTCVVTGFKFELVRGYLNSLKEKYETVVQHERKGTAHAVSMAKDFLKKNIDCDVLILNGDAPFIDSETITGAYRLHKKSSNVATIISAKIADPFGYGRIVRDEKTGNVISIVEQKDADSTTQAINEVNSGAYWFSVKALLDVLGKIKNNNSQGEFYLTDAIALLISQNLGVGSYASHCETTVLGANNLIQLNYLNEIARTKILKNLMLSGVNIPCTNGIIVAPNVKIGSATTILPGTIISGTTSIGQNCVIGPNSIIKNSTIPSGSHLCSVYCQNSSFQNPCQFAPFSVIKDVD